MPEFRKDPIVGRWTIIAEERAKRPMPLRQPSYLGSEGLCPFCEGNERFTPPEIAAFRGHGAGPNGTGWRVRAVPNRHPALAIEERLDKRGEGVYDRIGGVGAHEVIIEGPEHHDSLSCLTPERVREILWMYRDRLLDLKNDTRFVHGLIFKNRGAAAGATLEHGHSQLLMSPVTPPIIEQEINGARRFFDYRGRCIYCDIIEQELGDERRIVMDSSQFVVYCPYASRFPFEMAIAPKRHASRFDQLTKGEIDELGSVLREAVWRLELALDDPAYNSVIHSAAFDPHDLPHYHWHFEIVPRLAPIGGLEWGAGYFVNPVAPETAARCLRDVELRPHAPSNRIEWRMTSRQSGLLV